MFTTVNENFLIDVLRINNNRVKNLFNLSNSYKDFVEKGLDDYSINLLKNFREFITLFI